MSFRRRLLALAAILAAVAVLLIRHSPADEEEGDLVRLPIQHSQDDGKSLWYQPIALKHGAVRFHETSKTLSETSQLIDYTMWRKDDGDLERFWLILRPEPAKWRAAPPHSQASAISDSRRTVYEDLDGDSVFDTMVKVGPNTMSSYILFENCWIEVGNSKVKWDHRRTVRAVKGGAMYFFAKGAWRR